MKENQNPKLLHVGEIMDRHPVSVEPETGLSDVLHLFESHQIDVVAVIDSSSKPMGLVSAHNCLHSLLQSSFYCGEMPRVKEVMSTSFERIAPTETLVALAQKMENNPSTVYFVVEHDSLIGSVSLSKVVQLLRGELDDCSRSAHA